MLGVCPDSKDKVQEPVRRVLGNLDQALQGKHWELSQAAVGLGVHRG